MSSMGELTFFLGLQVKQKADGIFISQDKYVAEILKKFDFANVKTASTPIETQKPLVKDEEASDVDVHLYRSMIGSLMYLTASRPDIMFAVCACSRFQVTPKSSHLSAVKRIFRYLKGKPKLGLWYPRVSSFDLESYSDSDYAGANLDRKSTTGGCQFLGRRLISWQCKKQTIVATSTTEAEYVAAASCCGQVLWIQNQMLDYGFNFMNTKIYIDNESTICIVKNPVYHSKTKHIAIRHHFIRDAYEKKLIQVLKIHTDDNVADLLTKAFDVSRSLIEFKESLRSVTDGTKALLIPTLFILWLDKVSTDSAKLVPLGKVCTAIETLKKNTAKALISFLTTISLSTTMVVLDSCPKHNMVAYLEKSEGNAEFHEIIDFLKRSSIHHALTVSPVVSTTFVEQFWTSVKSKIINNVRHITAKATGKSVSISEASIRSDLLFDDADGIDSLPNQAIFDAIQLMGYEGDLTVLTFNKALFSPQWRPSEAQPTPSPAHTSEVPIEPQTESSPAHTSEVPIEQQTDPSPRPSPSTIIPDSIPESSGGNLGGHSSSNKSVSGNEGELTLQSVYDLCLSLCTQDEGRTRDIVDEDKEIGENILSTEGGDVYCTEEHIEGTEENFEGTEEHLEGTEENFEGTEEHIEGTEEQVESTDGHKKDDETITKVLLNMSQAKAVSKEKKKGVELKDVEETDKPRPESDGIPEAEKKFKQLESDEEMARKIQEEWEGEEERNRIAEEKAANEALIRNFDDIKARIEADRLLAEKLRRTRNREQFTIKKEQSSFHDTIAEIQNMLIEIRSFEEYKLCMRRLEDEVLKEESKEEVQKESKEEVQKESKEEEGVIKMNNVEEINQNVVIRSNGQKRYFSTLMRVLSIFDREDLNAVYQLVMDKFLDEIPEGFERVLWGDLMVMFNPDDESEFWGSQQDWKIVSWKLHSSSGVHTLVTETGLVVHMLVEKKYPLRKEVLMQMLKLKLESEEDSTMRHLELIRFIKKDCLPGVRKT
ncbi:putative ribonuclease H-like domain-containing protein [Tanacetum coccineum]